MPARDPMAFPKGEVRLDNLKRAFKRADTRPLVGVTQGGSSRKNAGCKPAATDGLWREPKKKEL